MERKFLPLACQRSRSLESTNQVLGEQPFVEEALNASPPYSVLRLKNDEIDSTEVVEAFMADVLCTTDLWGSVQLEKQAKVHFLRLDHHGRHLKTH